jgi:23S rRNA (cytosine1962-C5)-methyltransferase
VYRNHIPAEFKAKTGMWVHAQSGEASAYGLWDNDSQIALRIYSDRGPLDQAGVTARIKRAWDLRQGLLSRDTDAYRLINGEGDGLPAIVVDVYGPYAVLATYGEAVRVLVPLVVAALKLVVAPRGILWRSMTSDAKTAAPQWVEGEPAPSDLQIVECGARYFADLVEGHKTGLYLDQRENRQTLRRYCRDAHVLNLYAYTGGFSVPAALAGAQRVTSVDIAAPALQRAKDNFRLNQLEPERHQFQAADCFEFLKQRAAAHEMYDLVICDPPSMAHSRAQLDDALRAYTGINALGLRAVKDGGYYAASSCTAQVSPDAFPQMLARRAGRSAQIVHESGHAWDHPVKLAHPEGRYLKFVVLRVGGA